jgi:hypothetical protein
LLSEITGSYPYRDIFSFELTNVLPTSELMRTLSLNDMKTQTSPVNDINSILLNFVRNYLIMSYLELQNIIIRRILGIQNIDLLDQLNKILQEMEEKDIVQLSDYEKAVIKKGLDQVNEGDYKTNDDVFNKTEQWLKE